MKNLARYATWTASLIVLIMVFTSIDYFFHALREDWSVPDNYFRNKIIFGFLLGVPSLFLALKARQAWLRALIVSSIISVLLQARYLLEGYALDFVLIFMAIHFMILYVLSWFMFMIHGSYAKKSPRRS